MDAREFQDANAACGLLPGPASTQLSIFCAYRVAGPPGAILGGIGFIAPAVVLILALSVLFLAQSPPLWVRGAGAGAGAAVAAVAVQAARSLIGPSLDRVRAEPRAHRPLGSPTSPIGTAAAALLGSYLVLALLACGLIELADPAAARRTSRRSGCCVPGSVDRRRARRARLDGVQGRCALVRRWVRDHPVDAGRRGAYVSLDDQRAVPQRGRARSDHPRAGRGDRRGGRLRRTWTRRRRARRTRGVLAVVRVHPARPAADSTSYGRAGARAPSSTALARARSARSSAPRSCSAERCTRPGSS